MSNVADIKRKAVKITLEDGVERTLKFTLNAMADLEERYGTVQAAFDKLEQGNSMVALRTILWAGLKHEDPTLTELQVGDLIDIANMDQLTSSLDTAFKGDGITEEPVVGVVVPNAVIPT